MTKDPAAADRIEALIVSNEQWQVDYNEAVLDNLRLQAENERLREALNWYVMDDEKYIRAAREQSE